MSNNSSDTNFALELQGIDKRFGAVHANKNISLQVPAGTIHGIIGENGAGKSTLMNIIYGFYTADAGEIKINGQTQHLTNSKEAIAHGIGMVHQHFMLIDNFTVLENVILGAESGPMLNESLSKARTELERLAKEYQLDVPLDALIEDLPVGLQQRVEILKALYRGARILILDEPTGVLTPQETDHLFHIFDALRDQGVTILLITHKLREILAATNNVSVMRQGEMVAHRKTAETDKEELAELMVGRKVRLKVDKQQAEASKTLVSTHDLTYTDVMGVDRLKKVSMEIRSGEVVGIAGVSGNGQSELINSLAGLLAPASGSIKIGDTEITADNPSSPDSVRKMSVGHIPEDRLHMGLIKQFSAEESAILGHQNLDKYNGALLNKPKVIQSECERLMAEWDVRPQDPKLRSSLFSGGNQQKLIIAREVDQNPDVLLIGQPTRGVDIGAIEFIHKRIVELRDEGKGILLVSVELDEIMALSDRIIVMFDGQVVGEVAADQANEKILGMMMANIMPDELVADNGGQS
ncbi:ABC transporter ATP-binding protein [Shewanella gelidii]|uniref:Heme ABC transporter ATP-binding protein n=1 Tax=Shewanella gelidii TaxID=1642821 RepID=A0A917NCZ4_9GAMM|nr:ABC transporter ATP-binding protein [Shewanella gelidii]MCL1098118.1 ABC transporter ATP-binding protein [Shewanella gelidii]GGI90658.1 heme ABC transporter ATP-binding protein [Shewanella gelidii]